MTSQKFSRYRTILVDLVRKALHEPARRAIPSDSILTGAAAAILLLRDEAALYGPLAEGFGRLAHMGHMMATTQRQPMLVEPKGQRRPIYHGLVLHLHLAAFNLRYEQIPARLWSACEDQVSSAVAPARRVEQYCDVRPPVDQIDLVLWQALCLLEQAQALQRDVDVELIDAVVHQTISQPGPGEALHCREVHGAIDLWMYRELCGLHALAHLALQRRNTTWAKRVEQVALYHLEHTQPDHMTTQPWAVFAFAWSDKTASFAEQQIREATLQSGTTIRPLAALLLADAAHAMGAFVA